MFLIWKIVLLASFSITCPSVESIIQGKFTDYITDYDVILPRKVKRNGAFQSFDLKHSFSEITRKKRSVDSSDDVHYQVHIENKVYQLDLKPNLKLIAPGLRIEKRGAGSAQNITNIKIDPPEKHLCHYQGKVRGYKNSSAALSLCDGIVGNIKLDHWYYIEPLKLEEQRNNDEHLHVIYKRSLHSDSGICKNLRDDWWNGWAEEMYRTKIKNFFDPKQIVSKQTEKNLNKPRFLEVCLVADGKFILHHGHKEAEEYLLTLMNMASNYWHDASIGVLIDISVVRMIFLEKPKDEIDLQIVSNAEDTLKSFCKWQSPFNPSDPSHPSHYDISLLISRHDLCETNSDGCNLLGIAFLATACNKKDKNCAIVEENGLISAVVSAHEIGHVMGCTHDPEDSGCPMEMPDGSRSIMASQTQLSSHLWSSCSRDFVANLISSGLGECLSDEPTDHDYSMLNTPVGAIYDIEQQCKLSFGNDYMACPIGGDEVCKKLWCKKPGTNECVSKNEMVADGSFCGNNKWCYKGECVQEGERPNTVRGGWSDWAKWTKCSRTCGGGVSRRKRFCNNPRPQNGGADCLGPNIQYAMCNTQDCGPEDPRFRELQCAEHNNKLYKNEKFTWSPTPPPESDPNPCALYCVNENNVMAKLEPRVKDGTRCKPGAKDTCIHGICKRVGCDWIIDSDMEEDICGKCGGGGTHCEIIQHTFDQQKGSDYVLITIIPKGSMNIDVRELGPGENTLAVGQPSGTIYFNDNHVELAEGEYEFSGVKGVYTKPENNKEEIHIKGPLKESLSLYMCFFNDDNKGVQYNYVIPKNKPERTPQYQWEFIEWSPCTARCGGGTQISKPICVEKVGGKVSSTYCRELPYKPQPQTRSCHCHKCQTRWKAWRWRNCSGCLYKTGRRVRRVECTMESPKFGDSDEIIVRENKCNGTSPKSWEFCNALVPCSGQFYNSIKEEEEKEQDEDLLKTGYYDYCYNLEGMEDVTLNQSQEQPPDWKHDMYDIINNDDYNSDFNFIDDEKLETKKLRVNRKAQSRKMTPGQIIKDELKLSEVTLEVAKLGPGNVHMNLTEKDFENEGDAIPCYVPEQIMGFQGKDAIMNIKKLKEGKGIDWDLYGRSKNHIATIGQTSFPQFYPTNTTENWLKRKFSWAGFN